MPSLTINVNGENYTVGYDGTFDSPQGLLPALNNLGFGLFCFSLFHFHFAIGLFA